MKTDLRSLASISRLLLLFFLYCTPSFAQSGWYHVEKVSLDFHELIRVELQGSVVESKDPGLKSMNVPFLQTLHYFGSSARAERRYFPNITEIRAWILSEVCKETHEQTLKPLRETGSIGIHPIKSKITPNSVTAVGTRLETRGSALSETVYCSSTTP